MQQSDATISTPTGASGTNHRFLAVRVLAHPDVSRVGNFAPLFDLDSEGGTRRISLNRLEPEFRSPSGKRTGGLDHPRITRAPLEVSWKREGITLEYTAQKPVVEVNGRRFVGEIQIPFAELDEGVVVLSGKDLALWLGWLDLIEPAPPVEGLIGESTAIRKLRQQIHRVADLDVPVLLRGATGVGKELVAAAIHRYSHRAKSHYVAVNVAGVPSSMAASELFGHKRGAFTGAFEERKGYFAQADGGTLFLDEIGDVSFDVQALLLRAVQEGVIQPLGGHTRKVDVRLIAATDSDLESAVARREFREPLLRRFSYEIHVPSLRARRDDVGLLFYHLLRERLTAMGEGKRLDVGPAEAEPFVPAAFVAQMALHNWSGNVRELANVALRFAIENRGLPRAEISDDLLNLIRAPATTSIAIPKVAEALVASTVPSDADILACLQAENFRRERVAKRLGVSKSYLYKRLENNPLAPTAAEIPPEAIRSAIEASSGDLTGAAERLRVSPRALRLQLKRLKSD